VFRYPETDPTVHSPSHAPVLVTALAEFARPVSRRSWFQLAGSVMLFLAFWAAAYLALRVSLPLALVLTVPAAGFMVRIFIIQHDCGHDAFLRSRAANRVVGLLCSLVTLTPYASWRRQHARHHGESNNLDRRRANLDLYSNCRTVREYRQFSSLRRLVYRALRHPIVAHLILPPMIFLILYRVPFGASKGRERRSVWATNLAIAGWVAGLGMLLGFGPVALIELSTLFVASVVGVWLFGLQHKFEGAHWAREPEWDLTTAALAGSSCLRLPAVLQWFTGNIGFHQIHHLNPRVPNYRLQEAYEAIPALRRGVTLGLFDGLRAVRYVLWDEDSMKLVRFCDLRASAAPARAGA